MGTVGAREKATVGISNSLTLDFLRRSTQELLINGKWVAARSGKTFETTNPANEHVLALIAEGDKADEDDAVKAARTAQDRGLDRENGKYAIDLFTQVKSVYLKL